MVKVVYLNEFPKEKREKVLNRYFTQRGIDEIKNRGPLEASVVTYHYGKGKQVVIML